MADLNGVSDKLENEAYDHLILHHHYNQSQLRNCGHNHSFIGENVFRDRPEWRKPTYIYEEQVIKAQNRLLEDADLGWSRQKICYIDDPNFHSNAMPYNVFAAKELMDYATKNNMNVGSPRDVTKSLERSRMSFPFIFNDSFVPKRSSSEKSSAIVHLNRDKRLIVLSILMHSEAEYNLLLAVNLLLVSKGYYGARLRKETENLPLVLIGHIFFFEENKTQYFRTFDEMTKEIDVVKNALAQEKSIEEIQRKLQEEKEEREREEEEARKREKEKERKRLEEEARKREKERLEQEQQRLIAATEKEEEQRKKKIREAQRVKAKFPYLEVDARGNLWQFDKKSKVWKEIIVKLVTTARGFGGFQQTFGRTTTERPDFIS